MDLEELKKMKETVEGAARDVEQTIQTSASDFEKSWAETTGMNDAAIDQVLQTPALEYRHPKKKWRVKRSAMPQWFKARSGVRSKALSGAARVARYRPPQ
jgi:sec-independent protein translocase protein TatB